MATHRSLWQAPAASGPSGYRARQVVGRHCRHKLSRLEVAGASPGAVVKSNIFIASYEEQHANVLAGAESNNGFGGDGAPAATLVGVDSLYSSGILIEIEAIAVIEVSK